MNRHAFFVLAGAAALGSVIIGQQRQVQLPAPSAAHPNPSRVVPRPEGALPKVPEGFSVSVFADDVQSARMMEYAANGDLFVSQPGANAVLILRDTNNDGVPDM